MVLSLGLHPGFTDRCLKARLGSVENVSYRQNAYILEEVCQTSTDQ